MPNGPERFALFARMNEIIRRDLPVIVTFNVARVGLRQPWVKNFKRNIMLEQPFKYLDIDSAAQGQRAALVLSFVVRRVLYMIPVLLGVALLVFLLFNTVGEDPVRVALGRHATPQSIADLRHKWGLDQPLPLQFLGFLRQIVTFDYGVSFNTGESAQRGVQGRRRRCRCS